MLVQHGLLCSSADWVMSTPAKGLGKKLFYNIVLTIYYYFIDEFLINWVQN